MNSQFTLTRANIFVIAFFALMALLLSMLFSLLEPFLSSFVWATILVMVFYPVYSLILKWTGKHANLASLLCTIFVIALIAVPGFFVVISLGRELPWAYNLLSTAHLDEQSVWLMDKLKPIKLGSWFQALGLDATQTDEAVQKEIVTAFQNLSHLILGKMTDVFSNLPIFVMKVFFVAVALFFFFRDGARLALKTIEFLPMEKLHQQKVAHTLSVTVTAVVRAIFLTAFVEGVMACLGFAVAGVPVPILLGLLVFMSAFIPFIGATAIWVPAVIWLFFQDHVYAAAGLAIWGGLVSAVDHLMRPWLIGSEAKLPIFWLFFTTIGGLKVYGFLGIFLGPIILSLGMAFLAIYRELYLNVKPSSKRSRA